LAEAALPGAQAVAELGLRLARGSPADRAAFHAGYVSVAGDPAIDGVEVVTELRRAVLLAEACLAAGEPLPEAAALAEALGAFQGRLTVIARIRFHPRNGYTAVPRLDVRLGTGFSMQSALEVRTAAIEDAAAASGDGRAVIHGAVVEATFRPAHERAIQTLVIHVNNVYLLVATVDLSRMP
jgi:hypothetical protein